MDAQYWIPTVMRNGQYLDIYSSMLARGIIFVNAAIDQRVAGLINTCLLHINETADIVQPKIYLNTQKGDVLSAMAVVDVMQFLQKNERNPIAIETFGFGEIGVAAALILAAGTKGRRRAATHCQMSIRIGSANVGFEAIQATEAKSKEDAKLRQKALELVQRFSGLDLETARFYINNFEGYLEAEKAIELGLIDEKV